MSTKISERIKREKGITPQLITGGTKTSAWVSIKDFRRVLAELTTALVAAGSKATVQLLQAKDNAGTGSKALSVLVEKTAGAGGETLLLSAEAHASELDKDFTHVSVQVTCNDPAAGGVQGAAVILLADGRYGSI